MVAGLLERERQHSRSRRSTADLVRLYLQDIGRVDLLSQEEELTLARLVQRRELLLRQRQQLAGGNPRLARLDHLAEQRQREASRLGHQPSQGQWAQACQLNLAALRKALQEGNQAWAEQLGISSSELQQQLQGTDDPSQFALGGSRCQKISKPRHGTAGFSAGGNFGLGAGGGEI